MAEVKFNVEAVGIPKVKSDLKSVVDLSKQSLLQIQQAQERHVLKMTELKKKLSQVDNDLSVSNVAAHRRMLQSIEQEERRHSLRIKQMRERSSLSDQANSGLQMNTARHFLQAGGFYRTGHAFGALASITGGGGVGIGATIGAGAAFGGLMVAVSAVTTVFDTLKDAATATAGAFLGAATQLGGWKGLQQTIVDAAEEQGAARRATLSVPFAERFTPAEINQLSNDLSTTPGLGGFSRAENIASINQVGITSGRQRSFARSDFEFINKYAKRIGAKPEEVAKLFGTIGFQNKNFTGEDIQQSILAATGIGQSLSFGAQELLTAPKVTGAAAILGGGQGNIRTAMTLAGLIKPQAGSLEEAGVAEQALIREMRKYAGPLGIKLDPKTGRFLDVKQAIAQTVATPFSTLQANAPGVVTRESLQAFTSLQAQAQNQGTGNNLKEKVLSLFDKYDQQAVSIADFNRENDKLTDAAESLRISVEKFNNVLKSDMLPKALKRMADGANLIGDYFDAHKDQIRTFLNEFVKDLAYLALVIKGLASTMIDVGAGMVKMAIQTLPGGSFITGALGLGAGEKVEDFIKRKLAEPGANDDVVDRALKSAATQDFFGPSSASDRGPGPSPEQIQNLAQQLHDAATGTSGGVISEAERRQAEVLSGNITTAIDPKQADKDTENLSAIRRAVESLNDKAQTGRSVPVPVPGRNDGSNTGSGGDLFDVITRLGVR